MVLDQPHPQGMKLQCWVKLPWDQEIFHIYQPSPRHDPYFFPHTPWIESLTIPLCFINVHCRFNLSVKELRHLFHRNTTAAYLRDVLPHLGLKSFTKVWSSRNWFPATVFVCLHDTTYCCSVKLSFGYIPDSLYKEHRSIKTWLLSPRNLDHVICLVKLCLSWKTSPNIACISAHVEIAMPCWGETAKYYWFSLEQSWSPFQQLMPEVIHSLPWKSYHWLFSKVPALFLEWKFGLSISTTVPPRWVHGVFLTEPHLLSGSTVLQASPNTKAY